MIIKSKKNRQKMFKKLGQYFSEARKSAGVSQLEVSSELGFSSPQHISNIERGLASPNFDIIRKLIKIYVLSEARVIEDMANIQKEFLRSEIRGVEYKDKPSRNRLSS